MSTKLVRASFTLVRSEADLAQETSARPAPRAARRLVKNPQCVRVKVCKSNSLRWSNAVGFIPHWSKQCSDAVCESTRFLNGILLIWEWRAAVSGNRLAPGGLQRMVLGHTFFGRKIAEHNSFTA